MREDIWKLFEDMYHEGCNSIELRTGLVKRSVFDKESMRMYPMIEDDLYETDIETGVLQEAIEEGQKIKLYSFFLKADYSIVKRLANRVNTFAGTVITKNSPYHVTVEIRQNTSYIEVLQELELIYAKNDREWKTPCAPYVYKMFDVYMVDSDLPWYEEIEDILIDFEEYSQYIVKDYMPVWNLERQEIVTDLRAEKVADSLKYRHIINGRRLDKEFHYLVADACLDFTSQVTERGIEITCEEESERVWKLYRVETEKGVVLDDEIFSNHTHNEEITAVRTIGGITRVIRGLGYEERFILERVEITNQHEAQEEVYAAGEHRDMPYVRKYGLHLKLFFKSKKNDYLQTDVLSYLMSEVQRLYPEIRVMAELL